MPQINLSEKFDKRIMERLHAKTYTEAAVNRNYNFDGADTIRITSVDTMPMNDYQKSGDHRYGIPNDIGDTEQVEMIRKDRSFTGVIDKGDVQDQAVQKSASGCMKRQTDEVINPEIEKYRLKVMAEKAGYIAVESTLASLATGKETVFEAILKMGNASFNNLAPDEGKVCFITPELHSMLLVCPEFIKHIGADQTLKIKGDVGEVNNMTMIKVPRPYMPSGCELIMGHKDATVAVEKLKDMIIHQNPPGYNGNLLEGRIRYDAFVLDAKIALLGAIYSAGTLCVAPTITYTAGSTNTIAIAGASGDTIVYTLDGSDPRTSRNAVVYSEAISTAGWAAANGETRVRAYAKKNGCISSMVTDFVVPAAPVLIRPGR